MRKREKKLFSLSLTVDEWERVHLGLCAGYEDLDKVVLLKVSKRLAEARAELAAPERLVVRLLYDRDSEDPSEFDGQWRLHSFLRDHRNCVSPSDYETIGFRRKLEVGTAFVLDYYEHGGSMWSFHSEGRDFDFDTSRAAGVLAWEEPVKNLGAKTYEDRKKDARIFLDTYNAWMNGEVYGYVVETADGDHVDSCFGFYGNDLEHMFEEIRDATKGGVVVGVVGEARGISHDGDERLGAWVEEEDVHVAE